MLGTISVTRAEDYSASLPRPRFPFTDPGVKIAADSLHGGVYGKDDVASRRRAAAMNSRLVCTKDKNAGLGGRCTAAWLLTFCRLVKPASQPASQIREDELHRNVMVPSASR